MAELIWIKNNRTGETKQVEHTPESIVPLMVAGWSQCEPPPDGKEKQAEKEEGHE